MPNKVFTSFDVAAEVHELKDMIADSRVNNIYQLDPKTLLLKLHKSGIPTILLLLEAGRRFHLTSYAQEKPESPPAFCMALRKHLRNAWLRSVAQQEFERIVTFAFETHDKSLRLVLELFGDGNLILTDEKGEIIQALIFKHMRDRNIIRGEAYSLPPSSARNPLKASEEEVASDLKSCGDVEVVRAVARCLGIGGIYAEEVLLRAGITKSTLFTMLSDVDIHAIYASLWSLLGGISREEFEPRIVFADDGEYLDITPLNLKRYEGCKSQSFRTFNEALDQFYLKVTTTEKAMAGQGKMDALKREAEKVRHIVSEQEQTVNEAEAVAKRDKLLGDAIYANSVEVQALLDEFNVSLRGGNDLGVLASKCAAKTTTNKYQVKVENFDKRNLAINVQIGELHFSIGLRKSIFENAAEYYQRGKKAKQKANGASAALEDSRRRLAEIDLRIRNAEAARAIQSEEAMIQITKRKIGAKEWFEKFRWFTSSDGMLVVAGKDAVSNEVLVKKHVEKEDPVFHADITGAPFVVIKAGEKTPSEQTLREAAEFAAAFSRAWREGLGSADVYWVKPNQLRKTGPSGEYVAHGAFAVIGKRNWMRNVPLRTAVGVVENGMARFLGGPVDAVKAKTAIYTTLLPGNVVGKEILKMVLHVLALKAAKELRESVLKTSVEEIREFVPYTTGRIIDQLQRDVVR